MQNFDMNGVWEGAVTYRSEGQDLDGVCLWGYKVLDSGEQAVLDIMDLPLIDRLRWVLGVVYTITLYLWKVTKNKLLNNKSSSLSWDFFCCHLRQNLIIYCSS